MWKPPLGRKCWTLCPGSYKILYYIYPAPAIAGAATPKKKAP